MEADATQHVIQYEDSLASKMNHFWFNIISKKIWVRQKKLSNTKNCKICKLLVLHKRQRCHLGFSATLIIWGLIGPVSLYMLRKLVTKFTKDKAGIFNKACHDKTKQWVIWLDLTLWHLPLPHPPPHYTVNCWPCYHHVNNFKDCL